MSCCKKVAGDQATEFRHIFEQHAAQLKSMEAVMLESWLSLFSSHLAGSAGVPEDSQRGARQCEGDIMMFVWTKNRACKFLWLAWFCKEVQSAIVRIKWPSCRVARASEAEGEACA